MKNIWTSFPVSQDFFKFFLSVHTTQLEYSDVTYSNMGFLKSFFLAHEEDFLPSLFDDVCFKIQKKFVSFVFIPKQSYLFSI